MADQVSPWDIPSQQQAAPQQVTPLRLNTPEGMFAPRTPLFDQTCFIDIDTLSGVAPGITIFPAIPGTAYIIGQPSIICDNIAAFLATGVALGIYSTTFDPSGGKYLSNGVMGMGAGFAPPAGPLMTAPGAAIAAARFSASPGPGIAWLVIPVVRVVSV